MNLSDFPQLQSLSAIESERIAIETLLLMIGINDENGELWGYVRSLQRENQRDCLRKIDRWLIGCAGLIDSFVIALVLRDLGRLGDRDPENFAFVLKAVARHVNRKRPNEYREVFWDLCDRFCRREFGHGY